MPLPTTIFTFRLIVLRKNASNIISDATLPSIVSDFKSEVETETQIELSWTENASGNYYNLYRSVNDGPYELLLQTTETSYIDLNLDPGTVCSYQITSVSENTDLKVKEQVYSAALQDQLLPAALP